MNSTKEKNFVSAVVYVNNDEEVIGNFVSVLADILDKNFLNSEIICVNDFSEDNSVNEIIKLKEKIKSSQISLLNLSCFHGREVAMTAGTDLAIGDYVFEFDSAYMDYQMECVMATYNIALKGYDIVSASSDKPQYISSKVFYKIYKRYSQNHIEMYSESFRLLSRRAINRINSLTKSIPYRKALYTNCGLFYYRYSYKAVLGENKKKLDWRQKAYRKKLAISSLLLFTDAGYVAVKYMTYAMFMFLVSIVVYSLVIKIMGIPIPGWTSTILFLSIVFGGLFGVLTLIAKYLQLILEILFRKQNYIFKGVEKISNTQNED